MNEADVWGERARHSWRLLVAHSTRGRGRFRRTREPGRRRRVALWPLSQALWAASVVAATPRATPAGVGEEPTGPSQPVLRGSPDVLWNSLRWYQRGDAYLDNRPRGQHYFDDNAWIALVAAQQAQLTGEPKWWHRARNSAGFLEAGCAPDGGVLWVRGGATRNACSTGAAGLLFAVLATADTETTADTGATEDTGFYSGFRERMSQRAEDAAQFLHRYLLRSDGLISDHVRADGSVEPSVWTYNQGLAVALFHRTGHVDWADDLEAAVAVGLPEQERHRQPAAFTSIWYRTQLARHPHADVASLRDYLQHAWDHGRDARGLFTRVDRYDDGVVIDHAALTGLMAAYASPASVRAALL